MAIHFWGTPLSSFVDYEFWGAPFIHSAFHLFISEKLHKYVMVCRIFITFFVGVLVPYDRSSDYRSGKIFLHINLILEGITKQGTQTKIEINSNVAWLPQFEMFYADIIVNNVSLPKL